MTLNGNLEDLPLLDIIQVVSFSRKTGYLGIRTEAGQGAIVFKDGLVVSSFSWDSPREDPRAADLPETKRADLIRGRIEVALEQLIRLREGQFSFTLTQQTPASIGGRDIVAETLAEGINPQELILELTRGMDEDRRDSAAAIEASFAEPVSEAAAPAPPDAAPAPPPPEAAPAEEIRVILLVDDEEDVRRVLVEQLTQAGYQVVEADDPDSAVKKAGRLGKAGIEFLLVTDLGMPTSGGASFQGGFEVVKRLGKMKLHPPVLMMTESLGPSLHARAKQMGISSFVFKPGLSKLDPQQFRADLAAFAAKMAADVLPKIARPPRAAGAAPAPGPAAAVPPTAEEMSRQFSILQRRLEELRRPHDAMQISQLVMKVAREFFERAILFLVKGEEVRGLGGFGTAPRGESLDLTVREIAMPLSEPSVFLDVATSRKPLAGPVPDEKWSHHLMGRIGRFKSSSFALLPLLAHRETIALLFGDNPDTGRDFGRLDALEVFIDQAGVALENAFLQRKVQSTENPPMR